ncbi:MAG: hypothetical protein ACRDL7_08330 [Gaiellaceae bacterium]
MASDLLGALLGLTTTGNDASAGWPLADIAGSLDEMVLGGDDDAMVLGAALAAASPQAKQALTNAIRQRKLNQSSLVTPRAAAESNLQPLGFESLNVANGAQVQVNSQPQTLFKPQRLVVPATIAPSFVLNDIKVGNVSQLPSASPIPCESFVQGGFGVGLSRKTVNPAINLTLIVTNISGAAADFRATFFGVSVQ